MRPFLLLLLLAGVLAPAASAQRPAERGQGDAARPCIGLVLGGGGARGAAHIGVLKVLERERIPVCAIAGTSMGAIVGALYASGRTPEEIEATLGSVDWKDLFRDDPPRADLPMRRKEAQLNYRAELEAGWRDGAAVFPPGAVQGQKLGLLLRRLMLDASRTRRFDDLPIPFRAVAADIVSGERVVFAEGDLPLAVRASMAVPAVFAPAEIDGRLLVDGGIVDNVPVDVVRSMGADVVIAVDVGSPLLRRDELRSPADIAFQMVSVLMQERTRQTIASLGPGDVLIVPPLGEFSSAAFPEALTVVPKGIEAAEAESPRFRHLAVPEGEYAAWRAERQRAPGDAVAPTIGFVDVARGQSRTERLVAYRAQGLVGAPLDPDAVERAIASTYAEGSYQRIGWRVVEREGRTGIELLPVDKPWGPVFFNVGVQLSDDFRGRSDYQLTAELLKTGVSGDGDELRALLRLGRTTEASLDWFAPFDLDRRFYAGVDLGYRAFNVPLTLDGAQAAEVRVARNTFGVRFGLQTDPRWALELGVRRSALDGDPLVGLVGEGISQQAMAVGGRAVWDTLDRLSFPSRGTRATLGIERYEDWLGGEGEGWVARWRADTVLSRGKHHLLLGTRWAQTRGTPPELAAFSTLGGFLNLSGLLERGVVGERLAYGRAVYYYRFGEANALFAVPTYLGFSAELGQVRGVDESFDFGEATRSGGVFVGLSSPFGPLLFGYGRSNRGDDTWTLNFGNLIRNED